MSAQRGDYHHGDLRNALLNAALEALQQDGAGALGLRELARRVGVSHAAPYAHFPDKRALLAAVAEIGYARLHDALAAARAESGDSLESIGAMAVAYVRFGTTNAALYRVMFESPELVGYGGVASLETVGENLYALLLAEFDEEAAFGAWALVHGIVSLAINDRAGLADDEATTLESAARAAALTFARGAIRRE